METQNRLKSPVAWAALAALIFFVVKYWVGFEIPMFLVNSISLFESCFAISPID